MGLSARHHRTEVLAFCLLRTNRSLTASQENTIKSRIGSLISARKMLETHDRARSLPPLLI